MGWGSAPYIAVGSCKSVTGVEPKLHCSRATRSSTESDSVTIFTVGCKSWYAISHPPNTLHQQHYPPKPIKVSKPWVIQSSNIKVGHCDFDTLVANIFCKYDNIVVEKILENLADPELILETRPNCRVGRDNKVPLHWEAFHHIVLIPDAPLYGFRYAEFDFQNSFHCFPWSS